MTTAVKVDAHAGWPVEVVLAYGEQGPFRLETVVVESNTERTFYIHSGVRIIFVQEMKLPTVVPSP